MARAAAGQADDLLTACLLAATCPVLLVPAMNDHMWAHPQTQRNVGASPRLGYHNARARRRRAGRGRGQRSGANARTRNYIRSYRSSDRAGRSARWQARISSPRPYARGHRPRALHLEPQQRQDGRGARGGRVAPGRGVDLVAGPLAVATPPGVTVHAVEFDRRDGRCGRADCSRESDVLVMAAAPADFRPAAPATSKIKKTRARRRRSPSRRPPDILRATQARSDARER